MIPELTDVPLASVASAQAPQPAQPSQSGKRAIEVPPGQDTVALSVVAKLQASARELPEVREDLVGRIKSELSAGTYDQVGALDAALDRLLDEATGS